MWSWLSSSKGRRPMFLEFRSKDWFIIASVSIAVYTEIFLYAVVVPVLPFALTGRVGVPENEVQKWTATLLAVYAAFLLVFSPIAGWVADKTSTRRGPLLVSLVTFAGATLLLMLGRTVGALIAGRALQGASAAAVWSIGLALLVDTVGVDKIGEAMGYVSLSMSLGVFTGPLLGGVVYEKAGYYAVFYMCIGIIILDIILRLLIVERRIAKQWLPELEEAREAVDAEKVFEQHAVTATVASGSENEKQTLPTDVNVSGDHGSANPASADSAEHRSSSSPRPNVPSSHPRVGDDAESNANEPTAELKSRKTRTPAVFTLLSSRRLLVALLGTFVVSCVNTSFDTIIPLRVAELWQWNSIGAGLIFLAIIVPSLINPLVGKVTDRFGGRLFVTLGFIILCPALVCMRFVDHNSINQKVLLCALLALAGGSLSMLLVPVLAEITHCVESTQNRHPEKFGARGAFAQGYGVMNASYALGTLIGPIWSGFLKDSKGWATTMLSLGIFAGATAVPMFLCLGGWIGRRGWKAELFSPERALTRKHEGSRTSVDGQPGDTV